MNVKQLLDQQLKLHRDTSGKEITWAISDELAEFLDHNVSQGFKTLETGAGISTLIFTLKGASHTAVVPDIEQVKRIEHFCDAHNINREQLEFHVEISEKVLPAIEKDELDLVLIDGRHGFPAPFIDWYYTAGALKVGGILIVDDTHIWTGEILRDFLIEDTTWEMIDNLSGRVAIFRKLADGSHNQEWHIQPYVQKHSNHKLLYPKKAFATKYPNIDAALILVKEFKFITLIKKSIKHFFK